MKKLLKWSGIFWHWGRRRHECTELPLLFAGHEASVPLLDTMQIHIAKLIDVILEN